MNLRFQKLCISTFFFCLTGTLLSCTVDSTYQYFQQLASGSVESRADLFYLKLNTDDYTDNGRQAVPFILSSLDGEGFDISECGVNREDDSVEDTYCLLDINEMDLRTRY